MGSFSVVFSGLLVKPPDVLQESHQLAAPAFLVSTGNNTFCLAVTSKITIYYIAVMCVSFFRFINKQKEENGEISQELIAQIEDMVSKMDNLNFDKDLYGDDFSGSDNDSAEDLSPKE